MKPNIGITTQLDQNSHEWAAPVIGQNRQYPEAVLDAGGIALLLPYARTTNELRDIYDKLDGLLFAGGGDIHPSEYGEEPIAILHDVVPERDTQELQLVKWAVTEGKPILCICRGMQVMNVALGGTLIQDIQSEIEGSENHELSTEKESRLYLVHTLEIDPSSKLAHIIGTGSIQTNTHHHQAIKRLAQGLVVTSRAADGIIESVELADSQSGRNFGIGVQSHPESLTRSDPGWQKLFAAFVAAAETYSFDKLLKSSSTEASDALELV